MTELERHLNELGVVERRKPKPVPPPTRWVPPPPQPVFDENGDVLW